LYLNPNSKAYQYEFFGNLHEMDVFFTINKDYNNQENHIQAQNLKIKIEQEHAVTTYYEKQDKKILEQALDSYFNFIKEFKLNKIKQT
jgi:hypothetical protein